MSLLHDKIKGRSTLRLVNPDFTSPPLVELLGRSGFDALFLDCEHQFASVEQVQDLTRAAHYVGMLALVRPETSHPALLVRYLDTGADGLIVPHIETADQARAVVETVREAFWSAPDSKAIVLLLESVKGIENADEITAVEGLAGIMVGPTDLSQSMGYPGQPRHPEVRKVFDAIVPKAHARGLLAGAPIDYPGVAEGPADGGFIVSIHANVLLAQASRAHVAKLG